MVIERTSFSEADTAEYIGMSRSFLRQARMNGDRPGRVAGPPFLKIGRSVRYLRKDLEEWLLQHRVERPAADSPGSRDGKETRHGR